MKKSKIHGLAGLFAIFMIFTLWISTVISEIFLSQMAVTWVKQAVVYYGLAPLVLAMATLGITGHSLAKGYSGEVIKKKKNRMRILGLNGVLIMIPSALFLNYKSVLGEFDAWFYWIQVLELAVGCVQLILLSKSFRDGLVLTNKLKN